MAAVYASWRTETPCIRAFRRVTMAGQPSVIIYHRNYITYNGPARNRLETWSFVGRKYGTYTDAVLIRPRPNKSQVRARLTLEHGLGICLRDTVHADDPRPIVSVSPASSFQLWLQPPPERTPRRHPRRARPPSDNALLSSPSGHTVATARAHRVRANPCQNHTLYRTSLRSHTSRTFIAVEPNHCVLCIVFFADGLVRSETEFNGRNTSNCVFRGHCIL